jgi:hypothetical protein
MIDPKEDHMSNAPAPSKQSKAQQAYHQRQLEKGLVRLSVYVPADAKEEFWGAVDGLRASWRRRGLME